MCLQHSHKHTRASALCEAKEIHHISVSSCSLKRSLPPHRAHVERNPCSPPQHSVCILYYFMPSLFSSDNWTVGREGDTGRKAGTEGAQVQESIYSMYRCSRLQTNAAVKAESAGFIFPCNFVYAVFAKVSDVAVHHAPRAAPQSCRFWRAQLFPSWVA